MTDLKVKKNSISSKSDPSLFTKSKESEKHLLTRISEKFSIRCKQKVQYQRPTPKKTCSMC